MFKNFLIINKPSATLDQLNLWSKNKPVLFRSIIPIAYRLSLQYGIDPVLTIAQIALETGYCRFGGKVSPSHCNTCGLKTKDGKEFHKFDSWAQGIEAHVQHLALYANAPKLQGKKIVDPRHFDSLRGTAKTVNDLSMKWATNSDYGKKLNSLCEEIIKSH
jgi:flagellum-specific peptidoglycan hydrolase FlgJ